MTYAATLLTMATPYAVAQMSLPAAPTAPRAPRPAVESAPRLSRRLEETELDELDENEVDGPVKKIDPASQTIQVGWFLGLFRTTLEVTDDTHIAVDGMKASLLDIREGDTVKTSCEERDGKNLAKAIEVRPAEAKGRDGTQSRAPGFPTSPP